MLISDLYRTPDKTGTSKLLCLTLQMNIKIYGSTSSYIEGHWVLCKTTTISEVPVYLTLNLSVSLMLSHPFLSLSVCEKTLHNLLCRIHKYVTFIN